MTRSVGLLARIAALTVVWIATRAVLLRSVPGVEADLAQSPARETASALVQVAFLTATAISTVTVRSHWFGLRLFASLVALQIGLGTIVPLLELLAFPAYGATLPRGHLPQTLILGTTTSLVLSATAVLAFGRLRSSPVPHPGSLSSEHALARLAGGATAFVAMTILAAYLAMSHQPIMGFFHGLAGTSSFGDWLHSALTRYPWLPGAQALRSLVATGALLLVVAGDRGPRHLTAGLAGALLPVLAGSALLVPRPWLPETIRLTHLPEVIWTMLPLGVLLAELLLLGQRTPPVPDQRPSDPILGLDSE